MLQPPRAIIAIDGATGVGKSTIAAALAAQLRSSGLTVVILSLDLLSYGWHDLAGGVRRGGECAARFRADGRFDYQPYDWHLGRVSDERVSAAGQVLILDGCGAASREFAAAAADPAILDAAIIARASVATRTRRISQRDAYDWSDMREAWESQHEALSYGWLPNLIVIGEDD
ncbi:AAA domain-containing protein [Bowdeniella nasicola]|uniref:AAA domain-containing protein n=1 Tax=Bowdeniella nasicola TaxID=208480 RepID=A0A1H4AXF6_9ACTO|nr:hypothetical protein [Bowdeniella nasicola]SEA40468.1 AAA domain-containing protein [Bowdeniella nasicola]